MGFLYNSAEFNRVLAELSQTYQLAGPIRYSRQAEYSDTDYIGYGLFSTFEELVTTSKSWFSPKEFLFPVRETLFTFEGDNAKTPSLEEKPLIIFLRACDINGIDRLDRIFLDNGIGSDPYYARRRKNTTFFLIECTSDFDSCFCVSMNTNKSDAFAVALRFEENFVSAFVKDSTFEHILNKTGISHSYTPTFIQSNSTKVSLPPIESLTPDLFDHEFWAEYTRRCIACGRCNTSCVTCSCFTMNDIPKTETDPAKRRRQWAGCHIQNFSNMAGGHSFRKKNGERMRFKTMHKINDYFKRFGVHQCVGCGRCDDVCPERISFSLCINKLNTLVSNP
jgi:anaerobic sulfite reductase subunit A